ncbi:hypothetical protein AB0B63_18430 [Micromonospora sp. NPDC049081]|uniref:hypothetical protein n=1 Tax=Micromonospora sp. NPDC049081 TaxID=3155150 RepID=UPI003409B35F
MSRNYAQIFTAIWRDPDFIALSRPRQQAYFLLVTQPNVSAAGVLPLTVRRWAKLSTDTTTADLLADIAHLHQVGMVVVDEDTEELLVRSFVRHDNGYRNPRRQPSIRDAAADIESPRLRRALGRELVRLECPAWMPEMADVDLSLKEVPPTPIGGAFPQVNSHSDSHSDSQTRIDGMANRFQTARTTTPNPQPADHNPQPVPPPAAPAVPADAEALFASPAAPPAPKNPAGEARNRAFGLARWWTDLRKAAGTPVVAGGQNGPMHPVRSLVEQFTPHYGDEEIREALTQLDTGFPSKPALEKALVRLRREQQGRTAALPARYEPRGTVAHADRQVPPRENANVRNARGWLDIEVTTGGDLR